MAKTPLKLVHGPDGAEAVPMTPAEVAERQARRTEALARRNRPPAEKAAERLAEAKAGRGALPMAALIETLEQRDPGFRDALITNLATRET